MYPLHFDYMISPEKLERQVAVMRRLNPILDAVNRAISQGYKVERIDISSSLSEAAALAFSKTQEKPSTVFGYPVAVKDGMEHDFTVISI